MMRGLIKLLVAILVLHALWRLGTAYWDNYQFTDELRQVAQQIVDKHQPGVEEQARDRVLEIAARLSIPLQPAGVRVRQDIAHVYIDAVYTQRIEIIPGYRYPVPFSVSVDSWSIPGLR